VIRSHGRVVPSIQQRHSSQAPVGALVQDKVLLPVLVARSMALSFAQYSGAEL
jgi:hypothetical protein